MMRPLLDQSHLEVAWHAGQYQALPPVYVQNSALEIAWTRVVEATGTREGRMLAPFLTEGYEGLNIDDEEDFARARAAGRRRPRVRRPRRDVSRILATREARLARDALLRRRLAAVALRQGDDRRRPRRLVGGDRLARLADGLAGVVRDLAPLVVGRDPRAVEAIHWDLYRRTRQSPGSIVQKAIGGIENALLDLKGKALGVSVCELFGGPTRETVPLYWSHCGTTRARAWRGDRDAEARLLRGGHRARPRGRRARLRGVQDEHRRPRRRAAGADARLRPRRRHRPQPDPGAARGADAAARRVPRGNGRERRSRSST